jgi:tetratricopeptide (TPR) repeat protein
MRLAVLIAASPEGAGPVSDRGEVALPSVLVALGFTVLSLPAKDAPLLFPRALSGLEATDTLVVHVSGTLGPDGSVEGYGEGHGDAPGRSLMRLASIADALAERPCERTLVFVEASYRGVEDALVAVEQVEAVADALSSNAGSHTTVVAVHPISVEVANLVFTRAVFDAVRDVVQPDGTAFVAEAYRRARERQMAGVAASGFAFLRGGSPFPIAHGVSLSAPAVATERELAPVTEPHPLSVPPPSRPLRAIPSSIRALAAAAAPVAPIPVVPPPVQLAPPVIETPPALAPAGTSGVWVEMSDVIETSSLEALEARLAAAAAAGDHRLGVQLSRERLAHLTTPEARVDELFEIGRTLASKLHDLPEAVIALEEARSIDAAREDVLEALRRAYARLERWTEALEVTLSLAKRAADGPQRADLRVAASEFACDHLQDEEYAIELLELALEDSPTHEGALEALVRLRTSRGELAGLATALASLAHRLVDAGAGGRVWEVCERLAKLRRDDLGDAAGAVEALGIAKRLPLTELDARAVLAEQLLALGDEEGAIAELDAIVAVQPEHARAHGRLFSIHHRSGRNDRAYLSALALEELGLADAAAKELIEAHRADWGLRARGSLDDGAWNLLRADGADDVVEAVFRVSLRAGLAAEIENRAEGPVLDPSRRQPATSTATIVRCFQWAARALATPCPALYVLDEVRGGIAAVSAAEPTTALGPDVLRGVSSKTLAFLAGRHLTYFRPEYQVLVHFPTTEAAAALFFAAIDLLAPGTFVPPSMSIRVARAKHRLARHLRPDELAELSAAVGRLEARGGQVDLLGWIRSVELTANRAGLLLAGDLQTALTQVRAEAHGLTGLDIEERRKDLLAFSASRTLADLRATYVDTTPSSLRASVRPPTIESAVVHKDDPSLRESGERGDASRLMA